MLRLRRLAQSVAWRRSALARRVLEARRLRPTKGSCDMIKSACIVIPALFLAGCAADATSVESSESESESSESSAPPDEPVGEAASADSICVNSGGCLVCQNSGDDCGGTTIGCCDSPSFFCCSWNSCGTQCWS